ncbi:MAG TPA: hypothetical protein VN880_14855 [Solirubrobacteraceae bacterium]|nr:hypothetical protein [Solirubrobacteraceae bacterium]
MPEGLSASEVGKEIAHHKQEAEAEVAGGPPREHESRHRLISITEAIVLSIVALLAAWSGYSAAKWGTESSLSLAKASALRNTANLDTVQATQIRTLDSVSFNAALGAYETGNAKLFRLTLNRLRPGYKPAVMAWLALHPLKNPNAPPDPSYMPQYKIPDEAKAAALTVQATEEFNHGQSAASTADNYVRLTVLLAAVLFLVGISSHFPVLGGRYGLLGLAGALLIFSVVQLLGLPGPP